MTRCERCARRATCTQLCPAAERYASCDYVSLRERYRGEDFFITQTSTAWEAIQSKAYTPLPDYSCLSERENEILQAVRYQGFSYVEVAQMFEMTTGTLGSMLNRMKGKLATFFSIDRGV
jgi:hypothetical protein